MTDTPQPPITLVGVQRGGLDKTSATMDLSAIIPTTDDPDQPCPTLIDTGPVAAEHHDPVAREVAGNYDWVVLDSPPSMLDPLPIEG
ncbi:hypothetical protein [Nocardiopsis synnemataformans]|uniref:hypothetical protein n=1 Tax=Nocardiopsis synnemataformans TaxID=61305 RepID=UPI003EBE5AA6